MPFRFKAVSAETKHLIDLGDEVIRDCRALVKFGAGNQKQNVLQSHGISAYLTAKVQTCVNRAYDRPLRTASITCAYSAGNCSEQAAVAYTILRSKLTAAHAISVLASEPFEHAFVTIRSPHNAEVVCVDPWPINTQALLFERHWCNPGRSYALLQKTGGANPDYMARLNKHRPKDALLVRQYTAAEVGDVNAIIARSGMRDVLYCSNDGNTWVYKVRATWIADNQRAQCHGCNKAFSLNRRRHHCRSCGEVYCDACSTGRTVVRVPATEPGKAVVDVSNGAVRVCAPCLNQITTDGFGG
jgi:FYVE zinc finger